MAKEEKFKLTIDGGKVTMTWDGLPVPFETWSAHGKTANYGISVVPRSNLSPEEAKIIEEMRTDPHISVVGLPVRETKRR